MDVQQNAIADGSMFADYIDWRARHPADDLMTVLLNAEFEDDTGTVRTLSRDEVLAYTQVIAGAGNETTGRLIGWLGRILGDHADQRRALVEDRSLLPNAIEETLRFQPTGLHLARYVMRDVEYYGTTVPRQRDAPARGLGTATNAPCRPGPLRRPPQPRLAPHLRLRPPLLLGAPLAARRAWRSTRC
jgi:cytochrome P450